MKHLLQWVATHLKKPGYFCSLQIVASLVGVNAAGAVLTHFQTISHMAADPISHRIGSQILHSIPVLASLNGELDVNALTTPLAGAVVGALLTMIGSGLYSGSDLPQPSPYHEAWAQPTESAEPRRTSLHTEDPRWMNSVRLGSSSLVEEEGMQVNHVPEKIKFRLPITLESSDEELARRARGLLRWKIRYDSIQVKTVNGHVTLLGQVSWDLDRETAERTVRKLTGVVDVTNSIVTKIDVSWNAPR